MNSSATVSSSTSGLRAAVGEGDGFGRGVLATGDEEEAGETEGDAEDLGLAGADETGFADGVGDALGRGFTGPVGLSGAEGFGAGLGVGVGDGAAVTPESGRQTASAKI
jgi:hypothetical protein